MAEPFPRSLLRYKNSWLNSRVLSISMVFFPVVESPSASKISRVKLIQKKDLTRVMKQEHFIEDYVVLSYL